MVSVSSRVRVRVRPTLFMLGNITALNIETHCGITFCCCDMLKFDFFVFFLCCFHCSQIKSK